LGSKGRKHFSSNNGAIFNQEARLAADIPRHRDAHRPLPKMLASSGEKTKEAERKSVREKKQRE